MCGITGIYNTSQVNVDPSKIKIMTQTLAHRGPDAEGFHIKDKIGMGHRRLAIVDLTDAGRQPMITSDEKFALVYNGEIYNHLSLRKELEEADYTFNTQCDTEVILHGYCHWGLDILDKLIGMFAFAIWDEDKNELILARDDMGTKPLYYYHHQDTFAFASELRALIACPNLDLTFDPNGFQDYFTYQYFIAPNTLFKHIKRVPSGHYLRIQGKQIELKQYRTLSYEIPEASDAKSLEEYEEELDEVFTQTITDQLMGDVPIGVLLSGGMDSSAIVHYVHKTGGRLKTYNIGFDQVNEFQYSAIIRRKYDLDHVKIVTTIDEMKDSLEEYSDALDEPIADSACLPLYRLCQEMKKDVTVVLTGEGGDELFAGYSSYSHAFDEKMNKEEMFERFFERSSNFTDANRYLKDKDLEQTQFRYKKIFDDASHPLHGMMHFELLTWMPENLMMKTDKILMAHSLEGRFPFLHRPLIEFAHKLPLSLKLHPSGTSKYILKTLLNEPLGEKIIERRKMGFSSPLIQYMESFREKIYETLEEAEKTSLNEILDFKEIRSDIDGYYYKSSDIYFIKIWSTFILLYWLIHSSKVLK